MGLRPKADPAVGCDGQVETMQWWNNQMMGRRNSILRDLKKMIHRRFAHHFIMPTFHPFKLRAKPTDFSLKVIPLPSQSTGSAETCSI
jgi:hypothetical protein